MDPRGRARLCRACDKLVHDLSGMRESEARELLATSPESLCVRYLHDATGKIWFVDEPPPLVPASRLNRHKRGAVAVSLVVAPLLIQACGGADPWDGRYAPDAAAWSADPGDPAVEPDAGTEAADAGSDAADAASTD